MCLRDEHPCCKKRPARRNVLTAWPRNGEGASSLTAAWGLAIEKEDGSVHYTSNSDWGDAAAGLKETVDFLFFIPW